MTIWVSNGYLLSFFGGHKRQVWISKDGKVCCASFNPNYELRLNQGPLSQVVNLFHWNSFIQSFIHSSFHSFIHSIQHCRCHRHQDRRRRHHHHHHRRRHHLVNTTITVVFHSTSLITWPPLDKFHLEGDWKITELQMLTSWDDDVSDDEECPHWLTTLSSSLSLLIFINYCYYLLILFYY